MKTYRMTASGRRLTLILMLAAVLLWIFAVWALQGVLRIRYLDLAATFRAALRDGLGVGALIPAGILIVMAVAAPLLLWNLAEEWSTRYTVADDGLTYRTLPGIVLHYPWSALRELRAGEGEDAMGELIVRPGALTQIRNPILRWLHRQAFGNQRVPLYAGIEARDELLNEIIRRAGAGLIVADEHAVDTMPSTAE